MVARGFGLNGKSSYQNIAKPCIVNLQFTVTPTNGLGVTSLKSNGYVRNVFMNTSTTPASNNGATNPDPADGLCMIQLFNNFNTFLGIQSWSVQAPLTGSIKIDNSALTVGGLYVISTLGNATTAKWQTIGLPPGLTPAVGQSFIALTNGGAGDVLTSRVSTVTASSIVAVQIAGTPDTMINNSQLATYGGAYVFLQFMGATNASTTTLIPTAPATGTIVNLALAFDGSSVTVDGL